MPVIEERHAYYPDAHLMAAPGAVESPVQKRAREIWNERARLFRKKQRLEGAIARLEREYRELEEVRSDEALELGRRIAAEVQS